MRSSRLCDKSSLALRFLFLTTRVLIYGKPIGQQRDSLLKVGGGLENSPVALRSQTRPHLMLMGQGQLLLPSPNGVTLLYYVAFYLRFLNTGIGRNSSGKDRV